MVQVIRNHNRQESQCKLETIQTVAVHNGQYQFDCINIHGTFNPKIKD